MGLDCGSTTVKGVLYDGQQVVKSTLVPTSARPALRMHEVYDALICPEVAQVVTTGYGRDLLENADRRVTEITCHARGAAYLCGPAGGLIDIGGQDSKVVQLDGNGGVKDFLMNDKCAAGTGRFIEMMCRILDCSVDELDSFTQHGNPVEITSMCTVFAESEIISLLAQGADREAIALGVVRSICRRTASTASRLPLTGSIFFSGGLARFKVFRSNLESALGMKVVTHEQSQLCGAIGAAVIGYEKMKK